MKYLLLHYSYSILIYMHTPSVPAKMTHFLADMRLFELLLKSLTTEIKDGCKY